MDTYLVLKKDPSQGPNPLFDISSDNRNSIEFKKTGTRFGFNSVFNNSSNETIFNTVAKPLIDNHLLQNKDALLFTLGPTNSGKSHLMFKNADSILNQTLNHLFDQIQDQMVVDQDMIKRLIPDAVVDNNCQDCEDICAGDNDSRNKVITISMFEIHRDKINDLLLKTPATSKKTDLGIITDRTDGKLRPHHMTRHIVSSFDSASNLVNHGLANRRTSKTNMNSESSRSHCFIFIDLHELFGNYKKTYRLTLTDLAGLERSKTSKTTGLAFKETNYTNNSMTALGLALESLAIKQFNMSSLRANKLTRLIMTDHVKSNMAVSLVVALDPFGEQGLVHQTLRYINPIKYQDLKRKINKPIINRRISQGTHQGIIKALTGYANEWKNKYESSKEELSLSETKLRTELYELKEREIHDLELSHKSERQRLKDMLETDLNSKIDELNNINRNKLNDLETLIDQREKALATVKEESNALKDELENVFREKLLLESDIRQNKEDLNAKINKLENELQSSNDKANELQEDVNALKLEIEELQKEMEELSSSLETKNDSIKNLENMIDSNEKSLNQLKNEKTTLEIQLQEINEQLSQKTNLNSSIQSRLDEALNLIQSQAADNKSKSTELSETSKFYHENISKLEENLKMEQFRVESLESMKAKLEGQISKLREQHAVVISSMKADFAQVLTKEQSSHEKKLTFIENKLESQRCKSHKDARIETEAEEMRMVSYEITIKQLGEEIEGLQSSLESIQSQLNNSISEKERLSITEKDQAKLIGEKTKLFEELNARYSLIEQENSSLKTLHKALDEENAQHIEELNNLKDQMEEIDSKHYKEIETLKAEFQLLKKQSSDVSKKRKSLVDLNTSLLDSNPLETFSITRDVKSSPIKPTFDIHEDVSTTSTPTKRKVGRPRKSKTDIAQTKLAFAQEKASGKYPATPSPKKTASTKTPLGKLNDSAMNRKEMQLEAKNVLAKLNEKKRKTSSPLKPKKKLRKVSLGETSLDALD